MMARPFANCGAGQEFRSVVPVLRSDAEKKEFRVQAENN